MMKLGEQFQAGDWKQEKHLPVIECADSVKAGEKLAVTVSVGKQIAHPNTTEHHIRWIQLFFHPQGDKFSYQVGSWEFSAHGESSQGPNQGPAYSEPAVTATLTLKKPGTLHALSLCNIHGLWESAKDVQAG
jgi:superoxide reductase